MENVEENGIENKERREVLAALVKYSAVVGGASTVVLSASEAVAKSAASGTGYRPIDDRDRRKKKKRKKNKSTRRRKTFTYNFKNNR